MSGVVRCGGKALLAVVAATLTVATCPVQAAVFTPADNAALVAVVNTANTNGQSDTIELGGRTFTLTVVDNTLDGPNGLPAILPDGGSTLTIRNGTIERSAAAPPFRLLHVGIGSTLAIASATMRAGYLDGSGSGAALLNTGTLSVVDVTFLDNRAYPLYGGAIQNDGTLTVADCAFSGNSSSFGGAIGNEGTLSITRSTFTLCFAEFDGGALFNAGMISAIRNSTFSDNESVGGGAVFNSGSIASFTNSTLFGRNRGGQIRNALAGQILELASNIAAGFAAGELGDISNLGTIASASNNLIGIGDGSGIVDGVNGNQVGTSASPLDPLLGPLQDNGGPTFTRALLAGSPAIDAGSNPAALANDQRGPGFSRVSGAQADVGAFELQSADLSVAKFDTPDPVLAGASVTWTVTVQNAGPDTAKTVALSDPLPAGTTFVSLVTPAGWSCSTPTVGLNGTVSCSIASFPIDSASFTFVAAVDGVIPPGTFISNTATVTSATPDPDSADTSATATTTVISPALLSATKVVSGNFAPGGNVTYTIVLTNAGAGAQVDNPGNELVDVLPAELALVSATATSGTALATTGTNTVTWNGSIPAAGAITITVVVTVRTGTPAGTSISNQATIAYDLDGNGTNEAPGVSDDPATAAAGDATVFAVSDVAVVPVLGGPGLGLLALFVALGGAVVLGRRLS